MGLGRLLAECIVDEARAIGYGDAQARHLAADESGAAILCELGFRDTLPVRTTTRCPDYAPPRARAQRLRLVIQRR